MPGVKRAKLRVAWKRLLGGPRVVRRSAAEPGEYIPHQGKQECERRARQAERIVVNRHRRDCSIIAIDDALGQVWDVLKQEMPSSMVISFAPASPASLEPISVRWIEDVKAEFEAFPLGRHDELPPIEVTTPRFTTDKKA